MKPGGTKFRIIDEAKEIILSSLLFNDPNIFGYVRNTCNLRSFAKGLHKKLIFQLNSNTFRES